MKKYKCPRCLTTSSVIRYGYRKQVIRLFCKDCSRSFSVNPCFVNRRLILNSSNKLSNENFNNWLWKLYRDFKDDLLARNVLINIEKYKSELLGYRGIPQAPLTTNLIESLNGHLESRLQSLRAFQTIEYARLWLNGYVLKRRFTKFTDCKGKFRFLKGKSGVEQTKKERINLPLYF